MKARSTSRKPPRLVREMYGGEPYEYYPLGKYVVSGPGVCGGRPTFKYTRLEVSVILAMLESGESIEQLVAEYSRRELTPQAIKEAIRLARTALESSALALQPAV
jgi:uncharacterized protein (DUF433 family)